jgi:hypothetical protein
MVRLLDIPSVCLGIAALGAWVLSWRAENGDGPHPSRFVAPCLVASWIGSKVLAAAVGWPAAYDLFPWFDLVILLVVLTCFHFWSARWLVAQMFTLLTKMVWDAMYLMQLPNRVTIPHNVFVAIGNSLFAVEILCVATPGGLSLGREWGALLSGRWPRRGFLGLTRRGSAQKPGRP